MEQFSKVGGGGVGWTDPLLYVRLVSLQTDFNTFADLLNSRHEFSIGINYNICSVLAFKSFGFSAAIAFKVFSAIALKTLKCFYSV